jgi:hypothetical protein
VQRRKMRNYKLQITNYKFKIVFSVAVSSLLVIPLLCRAFSLDKFFEGFDDFFSGNGEGTEVINEVNVSTNTGGNSASNGEFPPVGGEGESKSEVHIKNIINGIEIDPIDITSGSSEVRVKNEINVPSNGGKAEVSREIEVDSEKTESNYEVDLTSEEKTEGSQNATSQEEINENSEDDGEEPPQQNLQFIKKWYLDFVENLSSFFKNIINKLI